MILLLIFILCLISDEGASKEVTGYSGGRVLIKCKYDTEYTQNLNYFCKDSWPNCCVATEDINEWVNFGGRFSLFDDPKSAEIRVIIRKLSEEDTGKYQCGFVKSWGTKICTPVKLDMQLDVQEVLSYEQSISKCVQAGEDLEFSCKYTGKIKNGCKFICKMQQENCCSPILSGQLSLHNDTEGSALISIIIPAVNESLPSPTAVEKSSVLPSTNPAPTSTEGLLTLIAVSVLVMLFLIGISVHSLILQIGHRIKAGKNFSAKSSVHGSGNNRKRPLHDPAPNIYSNTILHTSPSDSATCIYFIADPPTIPPDQDIFYNV